tara:strand:- start:964 stop:1722 length:759 start_codon:yes stop_codon:yes gene_type:complete
MKRSRKTVWEESVESLSHRIGGEYCITDEGATVTTTNDFERLQLEHLQLFQNYEVEHLTSCRSFRIHLTKQPRHLKYEVGDADTTITKANASLIADHFEWDEKMLTGAQALLTNMRQGHGRSLKFAKVIRWGGSNGFLFIFNARDHTTLKVADHHLPNVGKCWVEQTPRSATRSGALSHMGCSLRIVFAVADSEIAQQVHHGHQGHSTTLPSDASHGSSSTPPPSTDSPAAAEARRSGGDTPHPRTRVAWDD